MANTVLITGSTSGTEAMAAAVTSAGGEPIVARSPEELATALNTVGDGELQYYVQMPTSVTPFGSSVTTRIHNFLSEGLLTRYRTAEVVIPKLSDDARVVLVAGNVNSESSAPDDRRARLSLVHVLAHALKADKGSDGFHAEVAPAGTDAAAIASAVLTGTALTAATNAAHDAEAVVDPGLDYDDWRTEMLGGMPSEF